MPAKCGSVSSPVVKTEGGTQNASSIKCLLCRFSLSSGTLHFPICKVEAITELQTCSEVLVN